ncbi:MAG: gamma-glutamylcyclotransferase [Planctomycetaceae bacterium]|nr:gamma-glutamylcyclotransferase [Planctomycetaceae bacterium]
MTAQKPAVFVYGTLLFPEVTDALGIRLVNEGTSATLNGFQRLTIRLSACGNFPAIVPSSEHAVTGRVLTLHSPADLRTMDEFEGIEEGYYTRESVRVVMSGGQQREAFAYVCGVRLQPFLDGPWDPEQFRADDLRDYAGRLRGDGRS